MHHSPIVLDVLESHALNQVPYGYIIYNIRNKIETRQCLQILFATLLICLTKYF